MTGIIYIATNQVNLKSYVGQTQEPLSRRIVGHYSARTRGTHFGNALCKYPREAWEWRVLESDIPVHRLCDREELWIAFYDTYHNGYNSTPGGEQNSSQCPEVREKISSTMRAQIARGEHISQCPEVQARKSATMKSKGASGEHHMQQPEVAAKMSATKKKLFASGALVSPSVWMSKEQLLARGRKIQISKASNKAEARRKAGQEFLCDMEIDKCD